MNLLDQIISEIDKGIKFSIHNYQKESREYPAKEVIEDDLTEIQRNHSANLMRVNHSGEIAAQALYNGQMLFSRSEETKSHLEEAANEEKDHLAWCAKRIEELNGSESIFNPFWYLGSFSIGLIVGMNSDKFSLGFIAETEEQVGNHIKNHLERMPKDDSRSKAVLRKMEEDEEAHGSDAREMGGSKMPFLVSKLMSFGGEALRKISYII